MAGKYGSPDGWFLVDGYNLVSTKMQSFRFKIEALSEATTGVGDTWDEHTLTGLRRAEIEQGGAFFDTSANNSHDAFSAAVPATATVAGRIACLGFAAMTSGRPMTGVQGEFTTSYEVLGQQGGLTRANATDLVTGILQDGVVLHTHGAETGTTGNTEATSVDHTTEDAIRAIPITSSSVANPTVITTTVPHGLTTGDSVLIAGHSGSTPDINGEEDVTVTSTTTFTVVQNVTVGGTGGTIVEAKTASGGSGYVQVTALALGGYTSVTLVIRDSADDITFGDLVTFTATTTAPSAQRGAVAGTVERYLASEYTFNGAGSSQSVTFLAGFCRD